ncbi:hypothetical protein [Pseudomonas abietaniphila]
MISMELSAVQHNRSKSAEIAAAMAEYESRGGVVHELSVTRSVALPFNNETIAYGYKNSNESERKAQEALALERRTAEQLRAYVGLGLKQAAADMGISSKRLGHIAKEYGIVFPTKVRPPSALALKRQAEALLVPDIRRRFAEGATQQDISREFGLTADRLGRVAKDHSIDLPGAIDEAGDRKLIPRIESYRDLGIPRTTCAKRMGMSQKKLWRIIESYGVDYPIHAR